MSIQAAPVTVEVDLEEVARVLERIEPQIAADDHARLVAVVQALEETTKLVRDRGTTIARLRRLFGLASSEKTEDVCARSSGERASAPGGEPDVDGVGGDDVVPGDGDGDGDRGGADDDGDRGGGDGDGDRGGGDDDSDERGERDSYGGERGDAEPQHRKGHGRIPASAYADARHVGVAHPKLHAGDRCPDCARGKLHPLSEPARTVRITGRAPLAATCWDCQRLRCGGCGLVFTAPAPAEAQGPKYTDSAAAMMVLLRYGNGMPLHRLAHLQGNLQTPVPASTQWQVARDRAEPLRPVYDELARRAANGRVLHNDDTHVRILAFMGKGRAQLLAANALEDPERTGLFTTGIFADTDNGPIVLFFTGRKHAGENLAALLAERDADLGPPIQMCDGLARNLPKDHPVVLANCLAHGRRHIVDEAENFPSECRHVLEQLRIVFRNDAKYEKLALGPEQRLDMHQRESAPVMRELRSWIEAHLEHKRVEPNSGLGQAFKYLLDRWDALTLFTRVPGAPLDNNCIERGLKLAIRHRRNSLFYKSERGAHVGDLYMSLIYTADLQGENAFDYLTALLEHDRDLAADPAAWLPWTYRATLTMLDARRDARAA